MSLVQFRPEAPRAPPTGRVRTCGFSSFGRARPCQGRGGGFEPRNPLHQMSFERSKLIFIRRHSQAVRQRSAKPSSPVRFRVAPPNESTRPAGRVLSFGRATHANRQAPRTAGARVPVRIRRSEIEKLAFQAESTRIFAKGEIPGGDRPVRFLVASRL